ncbi:MAG: hypothetical protein Kow002_06150 [Anaerolineales bacterium]
MFQNMLYEMGRKFTLLYSRLLLKTDIHWHAPLPEGPKLFVANHPTATDAFLIHLIAPMHLMIAETAFATPIFGAYLRGAQQICVSRANGKAAFQQAIQRIKDGRSVGLFPEGWINLTVKNERGAYTGAARIALSTEAPVIPIGIYLDTKRARHIAANLTGQRTEAHWYLRGPYGMVVGHPMRFMGDPNDREYVHHVTHSIMERIAALEKESQERLCARGWLKSPAQMTT